MLVATIAHGQQPAPSVLLEVPVSIQSPGFQRLVIAFHDGEQFFLDAADLLTGLGYEVTTSSGLLVAVDQHRAITIDFQAGTLALNTAPPYPVSDDLALGRLISMDALLDLFQDDIHWDVQTLTLALSSAAQLFDPTALGPRRHLASERTAPLVFGRARKLFGGMILGYDITHTWRPVAGSYFSGGAHYIANMLGGAVRGRLSRHGQTALYTLDSRHPLFTRGEVGFLQRTRAPSLTPRVGVRLSNRPLVQLRVQRESAFGGYAPPHSIVSALVSGRPTDRAQADAAGAYHLRFPVYYGSTRGAVVVEPLGGAADTTLFHMLTPNAALPPGAAYYEVVAGQDAGYAALDYGLNGRITAGALAGYVHGEGLRGRMGLAVMPFRAVHATSEVDLHLTQARARLVAWRPYATASVTYTHVRTPALRRALAAALAVRRGALGGRLHARQTWHGVLGGWQITPAFYYRGPHRALLRGETTWRHYGAVGRTALYWRLGAGLRGRGRGAQWHAEAYGRGEEQRAAWGGSVNLYRRGWSLRLAGDLDPQTRALTGHLHLQIDLVVARLTARSLLAGGETHHVQRILGNVGIGRGGLRFSHIIQEEADALLRPFRDSNLNGQRDAGETLVEATMNIVGASLDRQRDGAYRAGQLHPYAAYQVTITPNSITEPLLVPATGYEFQFLVNPGQTTLLDIPLQPLPEVIGKIVGWPRALEMLTVVAVAGDTELARSPVFSGGAFHLRLPPGRHVLRAVEEATGRVVGETTATVGGAEVNVTIIIPTEPPPPVDRDQR